MTCKKIERINGAGKQIGGHCKLKLGTLFCGQNEYEKPLVLFIYRF